MLSCNQVTDVTASVRPVMMHDITVLVPDLTSVFTASIPEFKRIDDKL